MDSIHLNLAKVYPATGPARPAFVLPNHHVVDFAVSSWSSAHLPTAVSGTKHWFPFYPDVREADIGTRSFWSLSHVSGAKFSLAAAQPSAVIHQRM